MMSQPDDDNKTLGLPPGARDQLLKEIERQKKAEAPPASKASPPPPPPPPSRPKPQAPPPSPPRSATAGRPAAGESFETIPPAGGFRRRELPGMEPPKGERPPADRDSGTQPWETGLLASPAAPPREPAPPAVDSGWTMAGASAANPSAPWDEDPAFNTAAPPPPPPIRPATRPSPGVSPGATGDPWGGGGSEAVQHGPSSPPSPVDPSTPFVGLAGKAPGSSSTIGGARPRPASPVAQPPSTAPRADDGNRTVAYDRNLHAAQKALLTLQFYNTGLRRWSDLGQVRGERLELGRSTFQDWNSNPEDLAERHVRLIIAGDALMIEPLRSLNGVYLKLKPNRPVELAPHARFRIGRHVLEYRPGPPAADYDSLQSEDGEIFQSRVFAPLGFIDLIGPDGLAYLSHPLTKADDPGTRIGRGGPRCDLALMGDDWASSEHARLFFGGGACRLEDLKSTNGTYLQITEPTPIQCGSPLKVDSGDVVVIGGYMIRVVEERP